MSPFEGDLPGSNPGTSTIYLSWIKISGMNSTEEWLRYIESQVIMQQHGIKGYATGSTESSGSQE